MTAVVLCATLSLAACQREAEGPLSLSGKIFIFNVRLAKAYVQLTLDKRGEIAEGAMVIAEFEDPAIGPSAGPPLVARQRVFAGMTRIDLASPDMRCIREGRPYAIRIRLEAPDGRILQEITTMLASTIDQSVMPAEALVTGPAYDSNPAATGPDGKIRTADMRQCPK